MPEANSDSVSLVLFHSWIEEIRSGLLSTQERLPSAHIQAVSSGTAGSGWRVKLSGKMGWRNCGFVGGDDRENFPDTLVVFGAVRVNPQAVKNVVSKRTLFGFGSEDPRKSVVQFKEGGELVIPAPPARARYLLGLQAATP